MAYYVFNRSEELKVVPIQDLNGTVKTEVFIQPKSRAKIEQGYSVPSEFLKLNTMVLAKTVE
jgi:hypothetical protein